MEHLPTIIVIAVLLIAVAAIIGGMVKNKKKGKSSCGCSCGSCSMSGVCSAGRKKEEDIK